MTYLSPDQYLSYLDTFGSHPGLDAITELLDRLGNPQDLLKCVHITGTNGKGSVSAYVTSVLVEAGYLTGTYTSPEINDVRETVCINKNPIPFSKFDNYLKLISVHCEKMRLEGHRPPTRFEVLTALAFLYFKEEGCKTVVLEVGMGGRQDATNVIKKSLCSVITAIALDHTQFLGDTLEAIAYEKGGIIKPLCPVVLYPATPQVTEVFKEISRENAASLITADFTELKAASHNLNGQVFSYKNYSSLFVPLLGEHQLKNAALALEVLFVLKERGLIIKDEAVYQGLAKTSWAGRFEKVSDTPLFFIDGAHNVQGAQALADTLTGYFKDKEMIFIMGVLKDKDYEKICQITAPLARSIFTITPPNPRALPSTVLAETVKNYCQDTVICQGIREAALLALKKASPETIIVAFGSLYFIGQIPTALKSIL